MLLLTTAAWKVWLYENPWPTVAVCFTLAVIFWIKNAEKQTLQARLPSIALIVLAVGAWLLAWQVKTDREQLEINLKAMLNVTKDYDEKAFKAFLADDMVFTGEDGEVWWDKERWSRFSRPLEQINIMNHRINEQTLTLVNDEQATMEFSLTTRVAEQLSDPQETTWRMYWVKNEQGQWQVEEMQWLKHNDNPMRIPSAWGISF